MQQDVQYNELVDALVRLGYPQEAAEYHGALCGALCVLPAAQIDLGHLVEAGAGLSLSHDAQAEAALHRLRDQAQMMLENMESGFALLLPDDDNDLGYRTHALAMWCAGFLYGVASRPGLDLNQASEEVREIIADFTQFTRATSEVEDDAETEENAYTELVEYVRVGAQLVFLELRPRDPDAGEDAETLH
jgi:hypothetical protein